MRIWMDELYEGPPPTLDGRRPGTYLAAWTWRLMYGDGTRPDPVGILNAPRSLTRAEARRRFLR